ncbi:hypothetical protein DMUE_4773 [Dictyocoela muelleri]|nr:hypothetical protein DMUE_4773 [Dictyocoela muelleri]
MCNQEKLIKIQCFVGVSGRTLIKLKIYIISLIQDFFRFNPIRLGGYVRVINIDLTMLSHTVRSHRGRGPRVKTWAITIGDTSMMPAKGYAREVENRSAGV